MERSLSVSYARIENTSEREKGMSDQELINIITIEPGKRGGKPCIRGMRITVYDVLEYMT